MMGWKRYKVICYYPTAGTHAFIFYTWIPMFVEVKLSYSSGLGG